MMNPCITTAITTLGARNSPSCFAVLWPMGAGPSKRLDRQLPEPAFAHKQKHNQDKELNPFYKRHIGIN